MWQFSGILVLNLRGSEIPFALGVSGRLQEGCREVVRPSRFAREFVMGFLFVKLGTGFFCWLNLAS